MLAKVYSCAVVGLEGAIVEVEVDTANGLPSFTIVGLPDAAVQESRERVQAAIRNAGFYFPHKRLTVNLAPAALRKEGPAYDLPIALGARERCHRQHAAHAEGYRTVFVPMDDAREAALIPDVSVIPVGSLAQLVNHLSGAEPIPPLVVEPEVGGGEIFVPTDFREVKGQEHVKRALEVAAAGGQIGGIGLTPGGPGRPLHRRRGILRLSLPGQRPYRTPTQSTEWARGRRRSRIRPLRPEFTVQGSRNAPGTVRPGLMPAFNLKLARLVDEHMHLQPLEQSPPQLQVGVLPFGQVGPDLAYDLHELDQFARRPPTLQVCLRFGHLRA